MPNTVREALPDLVPSATVAELLDVDRATVTRWAQTGKLAAAAKAPGLRGANLFRREDVLNLLDARSAAA